MICFFLSYVETVKERVRKFEENIRAFSSQSCLIRKQSKIPAEKGTDDKAKERRDSLPNQRIKNQVDKSIDNPLDEKKDTQDNEFTKTGVDKNTENHAKKKRDFSVEKSMGTTSQASTKTTDLQRTKTPDIKSTDMQTVLRKTTEVDELTDTSSKCQGKGCL